MTNRFDLEQQILRCWHVTDDIELLYKNVMNKEMSTDEIANYLLGLKSIYSARFEEAFETFESCITNKEL